MAADLRLSVPSSSPVFQTLAGFAEELRATLVRIFAYLCGLLLLAVIAADFCSRIQDEMDMAPQASEREVAWRVLERPQIAFAAPISLGVNADLSDKSVFYDVLRHRSGGRKDQLRWAAPNDAMPAAALEIYRPGGELAGFGPPALAVAERIAPFHADGVQSAGIIDSKFGPVALVAFRVDGSRHCTGFVRASTMPLLQISGWSCEGADESSRDDSRRNWFAQRQSAACLLNRLTLLAAGSDTELADFFAHAELRRGPECSAVVPRSAGADWISVADRPDLRGALAAR